jgi:hypothetical protein
MLKLIGHELKSHIPFTAIGAVTGIIIMVIVVVTNLSSIVSTEVFHILHPLHVILSALTTTAMFRKYGHKPWWTGLLVGYVGSIGIASISDVFIPYLGGAMLNLDIQLHIPFISTETMHLLHVPTWTAINGAALLGILIGYIKPTTKLPHLGHVFLSTWASLFYFIAYAVADWLPLLPLIFVFLFLAVWIPCCVSDIVFPILVSGNRELLSHHHHHHADNILERGDA